MRDFSDMDQYRTSERNYGSSKNHAGRGPKGYARSDERIREDVCEALERDNHVDASEIEVKVKEGVVTLTGSVEDRRTKRLAEDAVEYLSGVKDVRNELTVDRSAFQNRQEGTTPESGSMKGTRSASTRH
jgi:osmotically-inducible protein OsmY